MPARQARIVAPVQVDALLQHIRGRKEASRCRVTIPLSLGAGLRAGERIILSNGLADATMEHCREFAADRVAFSFGVPRHQAGHRLDQL